MTTLLGPCDEPLPPYTEPEKILDGALTGLYIYPGLPNRPENKLAVYFTFTNEYEETLQDTVHFQGSIEIRSARIPAVKKTFQIGASNLHTGAERYDPITRILTIDPGESVSFTVSWDFISDDNGVDARQVIFDFYTDPNCETHCRAAREDLAISGELFVFDERAPVIASVVFPICYMVGAPCVIPLTDPPCLQPPSPTWARCYPFAVE